MKLKFILVNLLIILFTPLQIKSEEKINFENSNINNKSNEKSLKNNKSKITKIHIVRVGDTISSIAKLYSVDKDLIIKINNLKDKNKIYVGQNIIISNNYQNIFDEKNLKIKENEQIHIVEAGENLTDISLKYKLDLKHLIEINNLENPNSIIMGQKLLLNKKDLQSRESLSRLKENELNRLINNNKKYGPLKIQSAQLENFNGRKILNVLNQNDKKLILSINCKTKEMDVRIPGRKWRGWLPVEEEFEKLLINDFC